MIFPLEKAALQVWWFRNLLNYALVPRLSWLDVPWKFPAEDATGQDLPEAALSLAERIPPPAWGIHSTITYTPSHSLPVKGKIYSYMSGGTIQW